MTGPGPIARGLKRALWPSIALIVVLVVGHRLRDLDWSAVADALTTYGAWTVAAAFAFAVPGIAAASSYDLIGRYATGHDIPLPRTMLISFTGYFFSLNLGVIVGGLALRFRLYVPYGIQALKISQIIALSVLTNWSGFALICGGILTIAPPDLRGLASIDPWLVRGVGGLLLIVTAAYLAICRLKVGSTFRIRDTSIRLPSFGVAWIQIAVSCVNWASMGAIIAWLLPGVGWPAVMPVLVVSAIAGVFSHVPGGLGVTEAVFLTLLGDRAKEPELLAAILLFRAVYYFAPLVAALASYIYLEHGAGRPRDSAATSA